MTPFRVRIGELAKEAHEAVSFSGTQEGEVAAIESALLAFAREMLTQEPDEGMIKAGNEAAQSPQGYRHTMRGMWSAMSTVRAKSLEDAK